MADLISMRADAMEARKRIDSILNIDGELTVEQERELEQADTELRSLTEQIQKAEVRQSASEALALPTYDSRAIRRPSAQPKLDSRQQFLSNLKQAIRNGGMPEERAYTAPMDSANEAAALMPVDLQDEMIRLLSNVSAVRQAATIRSYGNDVEIPAVSARATITATTAEGGTYDPIGPEFSKLKIRSYKSAAETRLTEEVLNDSRGGVVSEILQQHSEAHGYFWETLFLGTGASQDAGAPDGILATEANIANSGVFPDVVDGSAAIKDVTAVGNTFAEVTYDELVEVAYGMPAAYWNTPKTWIVGPAMYRALLALDDSTGRPLLLPQATGTAQESRLTWNLLGYPVLVSDAMPAQANSAFAAVLLSRESYVVADRVGPGVASQVDPYTYGAAGQTAYRTMLRCDGRWLRPASSARLKLAAS